MDKKDYQRAVSTIKPDDNMKERLSHRVASKTKPDRRNVIWGRIAAAFAMICTVFVIALCLSDKNNQGLDLPIADSGNLTTPVTLSPEPTESISNFFIVTVHASDGTPTLLIPDVEVELEAYTPLMSSVPGLPFVIGEKNEEQMTTIEVSVDNGQLLTWGIDGVISNHGLAYTCIGQETLYWSPLNGETVIMDETRMILTAVDDGQIIGRKMLVIRYIDGDIPLYAARIVEE